MIERKQRESGAEVSISKITGILHKIAGEYKSQEFKDVKWQPVDPVGIYLEFLVAGELANNVLSDKAIQNDDGVEFETPEDEKMYTKFVEKYDNLAGQLADYSVASSSFRVAYNKVKAKIKESQGDFAATEIQHDYNLINQNGTRAV